MPTATITSRGPVAVPAEVRGALGLRPGSSVALVRTRDGSYGLVTATTNVTALKGMIPAPPRPVTLEEMDEAVARGGREVEQG